MQTFVSLAGIDPDGLTFVKDRLEPSDEQITLVITPVEITIPLAGLVDVEAEKERLTRELAEAESQIARLEKLLNSPFAQKAPEAVVEKERAKLAEYQETAERLKLQLG